jgi:L-ascorbate metabolism protein UlaG (beta-lactamase superfamily)
VIRVTHIGGPTVLVEAAGWRILTDPTFDPAGGDYRFGWGTGSTKLAGPAIAPDRLGEIDAILLSHDQHEDNLDRAGRALLPRAGVVVTTLPAAARLGGSAIGLRAWQTTTLQAPGKVPITVTATPCRHGPPLSHAIVGEVVGFALAWEGQRTGQLWVSGDTVLYDGVREVADRIDVDVALIHLGGVRFPISGPLHYTLTAEQAIELLGLIRPRVAVPIHYEGWRHFREGRNEIERALESAPDAVRRTVRWVALGDPTDL